MYTVTNNNKCEIVINKSRFISIIFFVRNVDEVKKKLDSVKTIYRGANHYCYAYVVNDLKKSSDDGEPGGTAGVPIMEVLNKNRLNYVLLVVVRYFGGIKLGAGGLVRAYTNASNEIIKNSEKVKIVNGYKILVDIDYSDKEMFDNIISNSECIYKYEESIKCILLCDQEIKNKICSHFKPYLIEEAEIFK